MEKPDHTDITRNGISVTVRQTVGDVTTEQKGRITGCYQMIDGKLTEIPLDMLEKSSDQ